MRFVEDISRFYGTGERNKAGQTLEEYLDGYDPRQFDLPSNTTDIIVVRCEEELKSWEQQMEVLLIKRGNHPGIGFWATPGGFVEMRENMDEGAARELEEETGIQGLPLVQMATWGDYDRDPRWRVITTSYLALVEGDLAVQAGDDAADALWFKVSLKQESNDTENRIEVWNLSLVNDEREIQVGAKVEVIHFPTSVGTAIFCVACARASFGISINAAARHTTRRKTLFKLGFIVLLFWFFNRYSINPAAASGFSLSQRRYNSKNVGASSSSIRGSSSLIFAITSLCQVGLFKISRYQANGVGLRLIISHTMNSAFFSGVCTKSSPERNTGILPNRRVRGVFCGTIPSGLNEA